MSTVADMPKMRAKRRRFPDSSIRSIIVQFLRDKVGQLLGAEVCMMCTGVFWTCFRCLMMRLSCIGLFSSHKLIKRDDLTESCNKYLKPDEAISSQLECWHRAWKELR